MIDRKRWSRSLPATGSWWICPQCKTGSLVVREENLKSCETAESRRDRDQGADPDYYQGRFSCLLWCNHGSCSDPVVVAGDTYLSEEWNAQREREYEMHYRPRFVHPAPEIIHVPTKCPKDIQITIAKAFGLFWMDSGSCLNQIRISVERVLTDIGVRRFSIGSGKRQRMNLHRRIEALRAKNAALGPLCDQLLAVKWLGNEGSHGEEVTRDTVFDAFDILESILRQRYDDAHSVIARLAKRINRKKGSG